MVSSTLSHHQPGSRISSYGGSDTLLMGFLAIALACGALGISHHAMRRAMRLSKILDVDSARALRCNSIDEYLNSTTKEQCFPPPSDHRPIGPRDEPTIIGDASTIRRDPILCYLADKSELLKVCAYNRVGEKSEDNREGKSSGVGGARADDTRIARNDLKNLSASRNEHAQ